MRLVLHMALSLGFALVLPDQATGQDFVPLGYDDFGRIEVPSTCMPYMDPFGWTCHDTFQLASGDEYYSYRLSARRFSTTGASLQLISASDAEAMALLEPLHQADRIDLVAYVQENLASTPISVTLIERDRLPEHALSCYTIEYEVGGFDFLSGLFAEVDIADIRSLRRELRCLARSGWWGRVMEITVSADFSFSAGNADAQMPVIRAEMDRGLASLQLP